MRPSISRVAYLYRLLLVRVQTRCAQKRNGRGREEDKRNGCKREHCEGCRTARFTNARVLFALH